MAVSDDQVVVVRFVRARGGFLRPTRHDRLWSVEVPCSRVTGEMLEPAPDGGWRLLPFPPEYDPGLVLAHLAHLAEQQVGKR